MTRVLLSGRAPRAGAATMAAAVLVGPRRVEIEAVPLPEPGADEVRVRLEGCGVCGSNVEPWEGQPWTEYPLAPGAPGHEGWGRVDALGKGVEGLAEGDRVTLLSYNAYAEYDVAPADAAVPLPSALDGRPFPGEPLACAVNIFRRSGIASGDTVAVVGIGFLGALLCRLAANAGARVIAVSRRAFALEIARAMGAEEAIALAAPAEVARRVEALTGGALCDVALEATGKQAPLDVAAELTRVRGRLVIAGYHQDGPRRVNMQLWNWRGLDVINAHERDPKLYLAAMRSAVSEAAAGAIDPAPLCTHFFSLEQLSGALEAARERPDGFLKAVVRP